MIASNPSDPARLIEHAGLWMDKADLSGAIEDLQDSLRFVLLFALILVQQLHKSKQWPGTAFYVF
ncbi:MAG TPA: hypothetical protein VN688_17755 [Gemmataceae bacterium]|nr:hypothetical protein [Gemmataceae bacterium]